MAGKGSPCYKSIFQSDDRGDKSWLYVKFILENFSVFSDGKISLSPNINVFIGANGTGKTQLLKAV